MNMLKANVLFYPVDLPKVQLQQMIHGILDVAALDRVDFPDEDGGTIERELAIPFLQGMDDVHVETAQICFRVISSKRSIEQYDVTQTSGDDVGVVVSMPRQSRLLEIFMSYPEFPSDVQQEVQRFTMLGGKIQSREAGPAMPNIELKVVIRPAIPSGSGFEFGPPIFAEPPFHLDSKLYDPILDGLAIHDLGNERIKLSVNALMGNAWLIQLAHGDSADVLKPVEFSATVHQVSIDAVPTDLTLNMDTGEGDVLLWSHPGALLPDVGIQEINFTPLAERRLSREFKEIKNSEGNLALAVPLQFLSGSGGAIDLTSKTLSALYSVKPLGAEPQKLDIDGGWTPMPLSVPAGREPSDSVIRWTAHLLGRELNNPAQIPPIQHPGHGMRVSISHWVSGSIPVEPASPSEQQEKVKIVSVRAYLETSTKVEAVLEIREDVAGIPGQPLTDPMVSQIDPNFCGWKEFNLSSPLELTPLEKPLWITMRTNQSDLFWYSGESGDVKISNDNGNTWGDPQSHLFPLAAPYIQIFHQLDGGSLPAPRLRIDIRERLITENLLTNPERLSDREFSFTEITLPSALIESILSSGGEGRVDIPLMLHSSTPFDLKIEEFSLLYQPFGN